MIYELLTNCKSTRHRPAAQAHRVCCDVKGHSHQWPDAAQVEAGSLTVTQYDLQTVCAKKKKTNKNLHIQSACPAMDPGATGATDQPGVHPNRALKGAGQAHAHRWKHVATSWKR